MQSCMYMHGMGGRPHNIVPSTLGRGTGEDWCLDFQEAVSVLQPPSKALHDSVPGAQVGSHARPPQVQHPILQPQLLPEPHS